jgi:predicted alpha/beta superfamily hydrolase
LTRIAPAATVEVAASRAITEESVLRAMDRRLVFSLWIAVAACAPPPEPAAVSPVAAPGSSLTSCPSGLPGASPPVGDAGLLASTTQPDAGAIARRVFIDAEERPVSGVTNGRDYVIYALLPDSYAAHPERKYPVVYVCDGYWDAPLIRSIEGKLVYDKTAPEFILIGFGYPGDHADYGKLRRWDYTPAVEAVPDGGAPDTGHAAEFLELVEHEIIPLVEREYRTDSSYRVLAGSSLGGLFTLYALFAKPGLFEAYIAVSPAVGFAGDWLFRYEAAFARNPAARDARARVFVSGADHESPAFFGAIQRFNAQVRAQANPGIQQQYRVVDGEHHAGTEGESYTRGLRFAFAPLAPPEK